MKNKHQFKKLLHQYEVPLANEKDIETTIAIGQNMLDHSVLRKTSIVSLMINQAKYISPFFWVAQFVAIIITVLLTTILNEPYAELQKILFSITPLLAFFAVPELIKSMLHGMMELEYVSKNSPAKILLLRLLIIGCINLTTITIMATFVAVQYSIPFTQAILYGLVPLNVVIGMNLFVFHIVKIRSSSITIGVTTCLVVLMKLITELSFFTVIGQTMWVVLFIATTAFLLIELYYFVAAMTKKEAAYQWN